MKEFIYIQVLQNWLYMNTQTLWNVVCCSFDIASKYWAIFDCPLAHNCVHMHTISWKGKYIFHDSN